MNTYIQSVYRTGRKGVRERSKKWVRSVKGGITACVHETPSVLCDGCQEEPNEESATGKNGSPRCQRDFEIGAGQGHYWNEVTTQRRHRRTLASCHGTLRR